MDTVPEPSDRSGGIDFEDSHVEAQDVIGRDKFEFNLSSAPQRGCYAQLSENIRFAIFLGLVLLVVYAVFKNSILPLLSRPTPTPTPTMVPTATDLMEVVPSPSVTEASELATPTGTPVVGKTATPAGPGSQGAPGVMTATATNVPRPISRPTRVVLTASPTATMKAQPTRIRRPPTPTRLPTATYQATSTPEPSPTPVPSSTATPSPTLVPSPTPVPPSPTLACFTASAGLSPATFTVTEGGTFGLSITLNCVPELAGYEVQVAFDPQVVIVEALADGGFLGSAGGSVFVTDPRINNTDGNAVLGATVLGPGPYSSGGGTLATVRLRAIGSGLSTLRLSVKLSDRNGRPWPVTVSGGRVEVVARATETPAPKPSSTPTLTPSRQPTFTLTPTTTSTATVRPTATGES